MDKLAVYVHWPYCARICPYCDFNVYKGHDNPDLTGAILQDLCFWREWSGPRKITSIHFGGGTPSLMPASDIGRVIERIDVLWNLPESAEIGLEANPNDADQSRWQSLTEAGVNRLSLGVQSFHDPALKMLGRDHDAGQARAAIKLAQEIIPNTSIDLIYGWTGQTPELLDADLDIALSFTPSHISAYQLTIEPGTAFAKAESRGQSRAVNGDQSADFYEQVSTRLSGEGYAHYEVSNFARGEARSRHNYAYWQGLDYVGVGPGAHGRLTKNGTRHATVASLRPDDYITFVSKSGNGLSETNVLSPSEAAGEYLLMGLRISEGIDLSEYEARAGKPLQTGRYEAFVSDGFLTCKNNRLIATSTGRPVLDYILQHLIA